MTIKVRLAKLEDEAAIREAHRRAVQETCKPYYGEEEIRAWSNPPRVTHLFEAAVKAGNFYVAEIDGTVVGFAHLDLTQGELMGLYVHPEFQGRGVGSNLLQVIEKQAKKNGIHRLQLRSTLNAESFYERAGHRPIERITYPINDQLQLACVRMEKILWPHFAV